MTDPIARIEQALTQLGAEHEPPAGWEARVMAAIAKTAETAPPKPPRWWLFAVPSVVVAAAVIVVLLRPRPQVVGRTVAVGTVAEDPGERHPFAITYGRNTRVAVRDGESAHVGDVAHATVTGGGRYCAVWIYRDEELVTACPGGGATACQSSREATTASVTLTRGTYEMVALTSRVPIAPPTGKLDLDLARAREAGATLDKKPVTVR